MSFDRPHPVAIFAVKTVHTAVFLVMLSSILWLAVSGLLRRRDRTVAVAAGLVAIEAAVFVANDGVCPLTPLTERLGATRGSVSDIFLPDPAPERFRSGRPRSSSPECCSTSARCFRAAHDQTRRQEYRRSKEEAR
jgi:hypothetical protein